MLPVTLRDDFILLLMETGNVSEAARRLGINRMTAYGWREDADFATRWDTALDVARNALTERVVETASELGLGRWVQVTDQNGDPILDDDFEPVVMFETDHVEPRVLMKLMDKTMRDEVRRVDQRTNRGGYLEVDSGEPKVVLYTPEGEMIDADFEDVDDDA